MAAGLNDNEIDRELLRTDPHGLVLKYQDVIRIIVRKYISSGMFDHQSFEDTVQSVNTTLLRNIGRAQVQYNGSTLVKTYVSSIIRNICLQLHHTQKRTLPTDRFEEDKFPRPNLIEERLTIEHSIAVFRAVLQQFDHQAKLPRLLVCLKLWYRIPLETSDILRWYPKCSETDLRCLLDSFGARYDQIPTKEVFRVFTQFANKAHQNNNSDDTVRRWTQSKITQILQLLNGSPPTASFDEESLRVLVEDYFSPYLLDG
jgi:DNA-directed RNA polymerase specialized sigma24 family protein